MSYSQYTNIPDVAFEQALLDLGYDSEGTLDGRILTVDIQGRTDLVIVNKGIQDLTGIEAFEALKYLNANQNSIATIDLSNLSNLEVLSLEDNGLQSLDLSANVELRNLTLNRNNLNQLNLTNNPALQSIIIRDNFLESIDLSQNVNLVDIQILNNQLQGIDLSANLKLRTLTLTDNLLTTIDVSNNSEIHTLNVTGNDMIELELESLQELEILSASFNNLTELNLSGLLNLKNVDAAVNDIDLILFEGVSTIERLVLNNNRLENLDISNFDINLTDSFNVLGNPSLTCVKVSNLDLAQERVSNGVWEVDSVVTSFSLSCFEFDPFIVNIIASTPRALEFPTINAQFLVELERPNDSGQNIEVFVNYNETSTASSQDFAPLPLSIVFSPQEQSVLIDVIPINDTEVELQEKVLVELSPGQGDYVLGNSSLAEVIIISEDIPQDTLPMNTFDVLVQSPSCEGELGAVTINKASSQSFVCIIRDEQTGIEFERDFMENKILVELISGRYIITFRDNEGNVLSAFKFVVDV